jgi:hypothetical protein
MSLFLKIHLHAGDNRILNRLLKNAHLRRYPAASPSRRRGKKSLLIRRDATPHPSSCQSTRQACCGVRRRERFETVPYKGFRAPP